MSELDQEHFAKIFPMLRVQNRLSHGLEETWSAWEERLGRPVTLKVYRLGNQENWDGLVQLRAEIWALSQSKHPATPKVFEDRESEIDGYNIYVVLETFEGNTLEYWQERNEDDVLSIAQEILLILNEIHNAETPLVHRNLTPANIVVSKDGLKLINFGSIHSIRPRTAEARQLWASTHESERFLSADMDRSLPRIDLYGLGITLIFLATGKIPMDMVREDGKLDWEVHDTIGLTSEFRDWINRMFEPDSEKRFLDASHALAALRKHWTDGLVKIYDGGRLQIETPPSQLIISSKSPTFQDYTLQVSLSVVAGVMGVWFWGISQFVSHTLFAVALIGAVWNVMDLFGKKMVLVIDSTGWKLTINGKTVDHGQVSSLEGLGYRRTREGTMLTIQKSDRPELFTNVDIDVRELEAVNTLIRQFKTSLR
ncbi:serine/threonine protein kinase [Microvenator marinus]|nr:hypothetical protein [Microvenator marinus]